jgi:3-hydroxyisobutyrate dehydrogenase-like beta-hydroxyacid dehydrogenase
MQIGFVGVGAMGEGMVRNLLAAGHGVAVYNRTRERAEALAAEGAVVVDSPAASCEGAALALSILADDGATEAMSFGVGGMVEGLAKGAVHACMATISVEQGRRLEETHRAAGQGYVSAPVFGRPPAAAAGKLFVVAAGANDAVAVCQPAFEAIGQRTFVAGEDPVMANIVKIGGNFMLASLIETLGEAFALTRSYDVDPQQFLEILTGSIFPAPVYQIYGGMVASDRYEPAGFKLPLGLKDVGLALEAAQAHTVPMPIGSLCRDQFLKALARGYHEFDWAGLGRVCAEDAGLSPLGQATPKDR